jgi:hypothetical protein
MGGHKTNMSGFISHRHLHPENRVGFQQPIARPKDLPHPVHGYPVLEKSHK